MALEEIVFYCHVKKTVEDVVNKTCTFPEGSSLGDRLAKEWTKEKCAGFETYGPDGTRCIYCGTSYICDHENKKLSQVKRIINKEE